MDQFGSDKSLLYNNGEPWAKIEDSNFDVTMGAYDGAEVCELIGIFMLSQLSNHINKEQIGLYRDDGLAIVKNTSGPEAEKLKKKFQKIFKEKDLDIIVQCNLKIVNYLDVTLNLNDGSYRPYKKPNEETNYIHVDSDHPPAVIKEIPRSIEKRLSTLSSSKTIFQESAIYYEKCLENSGYNTKLQYQKPKERSQNQKKRKRNIIWFNPPYSKTVKTSIGRKFINLINQHFPPNHKFVKIFNKNTLKLSYSCMPNIKSKINGHNKKVLKNKPTEQKRTCNCLVKEHCPMNGLCLTSSILYQATITSNNTKYKEKRYKGICETTFKKRYANHKKSFNIISYKNDTTLSTEYWTLKDKQQLPRLTWEIKGQYKSYNPVSKKCYLCLNEKLAIIDDPEETLLNKRSEIISQCRHRNKYKLINFTKGAFRTQSNM